jgi:hypothetical protein
MWTSEPYNSGQHHWIMSPMVFQEVVSATQSPSEKAFCRKKILASNGALGAQVLIAPEPGATAA